MVKKRSLCMGVLSVISLIVVQETQAADPLSILMMAKSAGPIAKCLVPVGALGYVAWTRSWARALHKQIKKNGSKLDLLQRDVGDLKVGQQEMRMQLHNLQEGQHKIHGSLGDMTRRIVELQQTQKGQHAKVCGDLRTMQTQLSDMHVQQGDIADKQDEILRVLTTQPVLFHLNTMNQPKTRVYHSGV